MYTLSVPTVRQVLISVILLVVVVGIVLSIGPCGGQSKAQAATLTPVVCRQVKSIAWVCPKSNSPLLSVLLKPWPDYAINGLSTRDLYWRAVKENRPVLSIYSTQYYPHVNMGGGWETRDGIGFRPSCMACANAWWWRWHGCIFYVQGRGRMVVGDSGPGWTSEMRFDLPASSAAASRKYDSGRGHDMIKMILVYDARKGK